MGLSHQACGGLTVLLGPVSGPATIGCFWSCHMRSDALNLEPAPVQSSLWATFLLDIGTHSSWAWKPSGAALFSLSLLGEACWACPEAWLLLICWGFYSPCLFFASISKCMIPNLKSHLCSGSFISDTNPGCQKPLTAPGG